MTKPIEQRAKKHIASFKVGDYVEGFVFPAKEITGTIVSIENNLAVIETKYGNLTTPLSLTRHIEK